MLTLILALKAEVEPEGGAGAGEQSVFLVPDEFILLPEAPARLDVGHMGERLGDFFGFLIFHFGLLSHYRTGVKLSTASIDHS